MKKTLLVLLSIAYHLSSFAQAPTLSISQPTCGSPLGTVLVTSPVSNSGPIAQNLYISEITDANLGALSYIEIYNGTGATVTLSDYKLRIFYNGSSTVNCDLSLSGSLDTGNVFVVAIGSSINLGGVTPNQTFIACGGFNTNDAVMLTTTNNTPIDLWGSTTGTVFTPQGLPGYTYRRHTDAVVPSLIWNATEWDAIDPEDYSNVGSYSTAVTYQYNLDGGAFQTSPIFNQLPVGTHVIIAQNMGTGASAPTQFDIVAAAPTLAVTDFFYPSPICSSTNLLVPIKAFNFTNGGIFSAMQPLLIDPSSGIINLAPTPPGSYLVTYTVAPNSALCLEGGVSSFNLIVFPTSAPPQGNSDQTLTVPNPTLMNLVVVPTNVSWYASYASALNLANLLPTFTPLVDGTTYFAVNNMNGCPSLPFPVTVHINLSTTTFTDFAFKIVPNPTHAKLMIQTTNNLSIDKIIISDFSGKTVLTQTATINNEVNVEQLAAGMYLIEGASGNRKFQAKFIKL